MAYTIPEYVDTQEQAILAVASVVKGEQVTGGDGSVNTALDILADTLAGENVEVPMTQQGAILALAQYVAGMVKPEGTIAITENGEGIDVAQYATADVSVSGGGVDVGNIVNIAAPSVDTDTIIATLGGERILMTDCVNADGIAAGMTVEITTHLAPPFTHGVTASYEQPDGTEGDFTDFTYTEVDATTGRITFVVPDLPIDDTDPSDIIYSTLSFWSAD